MFSFTTDYTDLIFKIIRSCFEFLQKVFLGLMYPFSCVLWAIFWPFSLLCYLPHHRSENASKTHPKSSHDKFKTASYSQSEMDCEKWNGTQRRRSAKFISLREQSTQRVALISVLFAFSHNYSSASLRLCVRFFRKPILFYYN